MFEKDLRMPRLIGFYGELLTERQREICAYYYDDDLSLAEVADLVGLSRQGVRDAVKKSESILLHAEEKLHLLSFFDERRLSLNSLIGRLERLEDHLDGEESKKSLREAISDAAKLLEREVT